MIPSGSTTRRTISNAILAAAVVFLIVFTVFALLAAERSANKSRLIDEATAAILAGGTVIINADICVDPKVKKPIRLENKGHPSMVVHNVLDRDCLSREGFDND